MRPAPQLTHLQSYPQPVEKPVEKSQVPYRTPLQNRKSRIIIYLSGLIFYSRSGPVFFFFQFFL